MKNKKELKIEKVSSKKTGNEYPCLKYGNKIVTFDKVILVAISGVKYKDLQALEEPLILAEL